jgi:hypothetical protein
VTRRVDRIRDRNRGEGREVIGWESLFKNSDFQEQCHSNRRQEKNVSGVFSAFAFASDSASSFFSADFCEQDRTWHSTAWYGVVWQEVPVVPSIALHKPESPFYLVEVGRGHPAFVLWYHEAVPLVVET